VTSDDAERASALTLDDVTHDYPGWHGVSGRLYAWLQRSSPPVVVRSADPAGLREEIRHVEADLG
jgi:hypothetical protein